MQAQKQAQKIPIPITVGGRALGWRDAQGDLHPAPEGAKVYLDSHVGLIPGVIEAARIEGPEAGVPARLMLRIKFDSGPKAKALHWSGATANAWEGRTEWFPAAGHIIPRACLSRRGLVILGHQWVIE
jgi:hypothetical protein